MCRAHHLALTLFVGLSFCGHLAISSDLPAECTTSDIQKISLPVYPNRPDSFHFDYRFQFVHAASIDAPTVIFIPGGPGETSIGNTSVLPQRAQGLLFLGLPDGMNMIFTDPRTAGCNGGDASIFPDDSLRTETLASDILAMIRALNLKKYIIYGHSYGTVLATEVASRAGSGEAPAPMAVVLSGVMGKSARDDESISRGLNTQWSALSVDLPKDLVARMGEAVPPASLSPEDWTYYLTNGLYRGSYVHDGRFSNELKDQLLLLQSESPKGELQFKAARDAHIPNILTDGFSDRLFKLIDCHEISSSDPNQFLFTSNAFAPVPGSDPCARESLDRSFDPAQWPVSGSHLLSLRKSRSGSALFRSPLSFRFSDNISSSLFHDRPGRWTR